MKGQDSLAKRPMLGESHRGSNSCTLTLPEMAFEPTLVAKENASRLPEEAAVRVRAPKLSRPSLSKHRAQPTGKRQSFFLAWIMNDS